MISYYLFYSKRKSFHIRKRTTEISESVSAWDIFFFRISLMSIFWTFYYFNRLPFITFTWFSVLSEWRFFWLWTNFSLDSLFFFFVPSHFFKSFSLSFEFPITRYSITYSNYHNSNFLLSWTASFFLFFCPSAYL